MKVLFDTLSPKQRESICFDWDHKDEERGLLRTRVANNWDITEHYVNDDDLYTKDQQEIIRSIFEGIINPEWHKRIDKQLDDDAGGYGEQQQHRHLRQAGQREVRVRDDRPAHDDPLRRQLGRARGVRRADFLRPRRRRLRRRPDAPRQRLLAAGRSGQQALQCSTASSRSRQLVPKGLPAEQKVGFRGKDGDFQGLPVTELSSDQKEHLQKVMAMLVEPYRQSDRDEVTQCLKAQGGLDNCHLAFYAQNDIGNDRCGTSGGSKARRSSGTSAARRTSTCGSILPTTRA